MPHSGDTEEERLNSSNKKNEEVLNNKDNNEDKLKGRITGVEVNRGSVTVTKPKNPHSRNTDWCWAEIQTNA